MLLIYTKEIQLKILPRAEFVNREQSLEKNKFGILKLILGQEI
jgi:hypothetical protein